MILKNKNDQVEIKFLHYAKDGAYSDNLKDVDNCVEIVLAFDAEEWEWGVVTDEYFFTSDIKALAENFDNIYNGFCNQFNYSADFPYENSQGKFYTITVTRCKNEFDVKLCIFDGLCDYIEISEKMNLLQFGKIVVEFKSAAEKFPVI